MRVHRLAFTVAIALSAAAPIAAQQPAPPARPAPGPMSMTDMMIAMHCGMMPSGAMPSGAMPSGAMPSGAMPAPMPGMRRDTMMHPMMMRMMSIPTPAMILMHQQQLGLNANQVNRLETLRTQGQTACMNDMRAGIAEVQAANQILESATPNMAAYSTKVKEAASRMAEGHIDMAKTVVEARAVLTPAQRQTLNGLIGQMEAGGR